ncbi:E3 ubiquitin-protein ligase TRIM56-like [Paramormyrops kingsleyae]|uniref:E3 ubiquitin-protein ligase TRIM56-like n=1 Tax=Paramormyrops kingsleyae TaxID=1676925 RepID=UPI003B975B51
MASQLSDKIQEHFLECKICFEVYRTPRTLVCLHSFCEPCLEKLLDKATGTVTCPDCRMVSDLKGSVSNAKASFFINSLLDLLHSKTAKETFCSVCLALGKNNVPASSRCLDCADFLCLACAEVHCLSKLTLDHRVVSLTDFSAGLHDEEARLKQEHRCQSHREPLRFFCDTCCSPICRDCRMLGHFSHEVQSLGQAALARRPHLEQLISSLDSNIESLTQKEQEVDSAIQQLEEDKEMIEDQLSGYVSEIIEQLFAQKSAISEQLSIFVEQQKQKCLSIKDDVHHLVSSAHNTKEFSTQVLQKGKDYEVLDLEGAIQGQIERLQKINIPEIERQTPILTISGGSESFCIKTEIFKLRFDSASNSLENSTTGDTNTSSEMKLSAETTIEKSPENPTVPQTAEHNEPTSFTPVPHQADGQNLPTYFSVIRSFDVSDAFYSNEENITGIALFPSRDIVIADNANNIIKRVIRTGIIRETISTDNRGWNDLEPFSTVICDNTIFFTSGSRLFKIPPSEDNDFIQVCNLRGSHDKYCIAAYEDEYIAVSEGIGCCLSLYTTEGNLVGRVSPSGYEGKFTFFTVNSREEFIVSDTKNRRVLIISREGNIMHICSDVNCPPFNPTSVCVDKFDNIYVLSGKRIILLSPLGSFEREILSFASYTPKLIAADKHGHLMVVSRKGAVRLYKVVYGKN